MTQPTEQPGFVWKDFSRYVEVHPVRTGWLVVWGRYTAAGAEKHIHGNRTYADLAAARRRVADAALELTRKPHLTEDALIRFDRYPFPDHQPDALREPL